GVMIIGPQLGLAVRPPSNLWAFIRAESGRRAPADLLKPPLAVDIGARRLVLEHLVGLDLVIGDRGDGEVAVLIASRVVLYLHVDLAQSQVDRCPADGLVDKLRKIFRIERPDRLDREGRPAVAAGLEAEQPAFDRMAVLKLE